MLRSLFNRSRGSKKISRSKASRLRKRRFQFLETLEPRLALALSNYIAPDFTSWPVDQNTGMPYFHSYSAAPATFYMDYDGDPGSGSSDNNFQPFAPFDTDGDPTHFLGTDERNTMWTQWRRLSTYLAPFNIDVTTQYVNPTTRPVSWLCISDTQSQFNKGEFSLTGFGSQDNYAHGFIPPFYRPQDFAHEAGHSFGDKHQSNIDEFFQESQSYGGPSSQVNGGPVDLLNGAIMGDKNGIINKFLTWNQVGQLGASQDSFATIASAISSKTGVSGFRPDDFVNTLDPTAPTIASGIPRKGIIETISDTDYFKFDVTTAGASYAVSLTRDLNSPVDLNLLVQNSGNGLVASFNGDTRSVASKQMVNDAHVMLTNLGVGTYYIRVSGNRNGGDAGPYVLRLDRFYDNLWRSTDIGQSVDGGYAYQVGSGTSFVVRGSGSDIWGNADGGHLLYKRLSGDGDIIAATSNFSSSLTTIDDWAKVGIMMRSSLDPGALEVSLLDTWRNGTVVQHRTTINGDTSTDYQNGGNYVPGQATRYLRLSRRGTTFTAYISTDSGATYNQVWTANLTGWFSTIYVGLVTSSHNNSSAVSGSFSGAIVIPIGAGQINPTGLTVDNSLPVPATPLPSQNGGGSTFVTWSRVNDANVTGYYVERSANNIDWAMDSIVSQTASGVDPSLTRSFLNDANYYYFRVRSRNAQGYVSNVGSSVGYVLIQPKEVSNLRAIVTGISITLQWTDVAGETTYRAQYSDNYDAANPGAATWTTSFTSIPANTTQWTDQSNPTRRAYRIQTQQVGVVTATSSVLVTGARIAAPTNLAITGISGTSITLGWTAPNVAGGVTYTVQRSETRRQLSWITQASGLTTTSYTNATVPGKSYYYRVIAQSITTGGRNVSSVVFRGSWGTPLSGFNDATVGSVGGIGAVNAPNGFGGDITVTGSGGDVWAGSDNMHYTFTQLANASTMTVHVASFGSGDDSTSDQEWARAGISFRSGIGTGDISVGLYVTRKHGVEMQWRSATNGSTSMTTQTNPPSGFFNGGVWLKLARLSGSTYRGSFSTDSTNGLDGTWTTITTVVMSTMPLNFVGGLAVSSHDNNYMYTAQFDHLSISTG